jgi:DNA-binding response OmpR family regulator
LNDWGEENALEQPAKRVLVVDDDADTCALIVDILQDDGYWIYPCLSGERALEVIKRERFDLILSDIKMPRVTGIDLLLHVRRMGLDTKVIMMTAYASLQTAIEALRGEAFDYLIKPFSLSELRQRVRLALQTEPSSPPPHVMMRYKDLLVDPNARHVWNGEQEVRLTKKEFDVLIYLFERQGCPVPWQELLKKAWGCSDPNQRSVRTVRSCIRRLRQSIGDDAHAPRYIFNVWGVGYQLGE